MLLGMDEVGRGALAGPVAVCCVAIPTTIVPKLKPIIASNNHTNNKNHNYNDSKILSPKQRTEIHKYLTNNKNITYHVAYYTNKQIDELGLQLCIHKAAQQALTKILNRINTNQPKNIAVDYIANIENSLKPLAHTKTTITVTKKGDTKFLEIAAASIIAKVERDNLMQQLHQKYPQYQLNNNKGYGTKKHIQAIKQHGLSNIHRKTFHIKNMADDN